MAHEVETMFSYREVPWHGLGTIVQEAQTSEQAIIQAGLDWNVELAKLYMKDGAAPDGYTGVDRYATVRTDRNEALGYVSAKYKPVQNRECFTFFDEIVGSGEAVFHTAGSLRNGRRVWMLAKLPGDIEVAGVDRVGKWLLFTNCHDGTEAARVRFTPIRVVCMNTLRAALRTSDVEARVLHAGNLSWQFQEARDLLGIAARTFEKSAEEYEAMASADLTIAKAGEYFERLVPDNPDAKRNTRTANVRANLLHLFEHGKGNELAGVRGTGWAAYNAVTEWLDHSRLQRSTDERRLWASWFGSGEGIRERAHREALALVA